jgi:DNA mismatch repair ATPase MutS
MENIIRYYKNKVVEQKELIRQLNNKIHITGTARLILFISTCVLLWSIRTYETSYLWSIAITGLIVFLLLMVIHTKLFNKRAYAETLVQLCEDELKGFNYDYSAFENGKAYINPTHAFGVDLDLFGKRSLFQSINRTVSSVGQDCLAQWFISPLTHRDDIMLRQAAVEELSKEVALCQHFYVTGALSRGSKQDKEILNNLSTTKQFFANSLIWKTVQWVVPMGWLAGFTLYQYDIISHVPLLVYFFCTLALSYSQTKKVNLLHNRIDRIKNILSTYAQLMKIIENSEAQCAELNQIKATLRRGSTYASQAIKQLSKIIGQLDIRFNIAAGAVLNIFLLWDIRQSINIERWKANYQLEVNQWMDALAQYDALCSLAMFKYNHPAYKFPEITTDYFCMEGEGLGHPLLHRDKCVANDIALSKAPHFLIITGANMAGKSTYLRTIGINYTLACMGAPVCAQRLKIYPAQLVTSLRTTDSLADDESYFFAELKRLKMIIDRLTQGEKLFIILDEILKGTNSVDKQKGSLALMRQLVRKQSCGIIATHDLMLGELSNEFKGDVENFCFEADIQNEQLSFTYKLRKGVAQNMNACFLMDKMGITGIE